jgi:predicted metal-dependent phosphoesterase TrpH
MSPGAVMQAAMMKGIDILALTDHNSMANCPAYARVARRYGIHFLPGVEIQTNEDIHVIALFDSLPEEFQTELYAALPNIPNDPEFFGDQVIVDENENILGFEPKALINSVEWSLEETLEIVERHGGFAFPAHVDAPANSILSQLGFIPEHIHFPALGTTAKIDLKKTFTEYPILKKYTLLRSSDAHYVVDIGSGCTGFYLSEPTLSEIRAACEQRDGRTVSWEEP